MSVVRSVSTSKLCGPLNIGPMVSHEKELSEFEVENAGCKSQLKICNILTSKAQTLDRFSRLQSGYQHGEKRKKSFFASFRLSKKSFGKEKEDKESSGSDLSQSSSPVKSKENYNSDSSSERLISSTTKDGLSKPPKHYLSRVSSFVNRVANKVQNGDSNFVLRKHKLDRSHTFTSSDLVSTMPDYFNFKENEVPGVIGIRNHGNTCFINAVIQCLSHTDILSEYFVLDHYKNDLARCNRINSKKFGTKGEITEHLAILLKSLWLLRYAPDISLNLKNIIEKFESSYRGSNQHDSAEFLMFILDKVHEDLNTASKRKYKKTKNPYGRPDEVVAAEALANHLRCNSSFIQDLFQAQFRSSLKCPHCLKESNTFDPYLCVSVPIPQKELLPIYVSVVYLNQQPKQVMIGVTVDSSGTIKQLRDMVATDCGICPERLILTEVDGESFHRTFADNASVSIIHSNDPIYAIELTPRASDCEETEFLHVVWMNVLKAEPSDIRFGGVFQSHISRDVGYSDLQKLLLKEMSLIVSSETLVSGQKNGIFTISVDNGTKSVIPLDPDLDLPLLHQAVDEALSICHPLAGPSHVKLVLHWSMDNKEKYITDDVDHVDEHLSVRELKEKPPDFSSVLLSDCLQLHTSAELLSCGDAWHCPTCNRKQQVLKRLNLWSAPQVLVVHLKRFKQASQNDSAKLTTVVNFPLTGFDISDHMAGRQYFSTPSTTGLDIPGTNNKALNGVWSPWKRPKKPSSAESDNVYDLYAVCNHHGRDLQSGHYTATCLNPSNGKWYLYDDFKVEEVSVDEVAAKDAYILFYQRRENSTDLGQSERATKHWSYRIPLTIIPDVLKTETKTEQTSTSRGDTANDNSKEPSGSTFDEHSDETIMPDDNIGASLADKLSLASSCHESDFAKVTISENAKSYLNVDTIKVEMNAPTSSSPEDVLDVDHPSPSDSEYEDVIPEVRIQPASLEVLASHKCRSRQSDEKEAVKDGCHESSPFSRPGSVDSDSIEQTVDKRQGIDGLPSSCDEDTPEITINSSLVSGQRRLKPPSCRRSNVNKTPSFVFVRSPSSSPRQGVRERSSAPSLSCRSSQKFGSTNVLRGNEISSALAKTKEKRPSSYSGASNGTCPTGVRGKQCVEAAKDYHQKTKSVSCVMECRPKQDNHERLTESTV